MQSSEQEKSAFAARTKIYPRLDTKYKKKNWPRRNFFIRMCICVYALGINLLYNDLSSSVAMPCIRCTAFVPSHIRYHHYFLLGKNIQFLCNL